MNKIFIFLFLNSTLNKNYYKKDYKEGELKGEVIILFQYH